jgi:VanZ family protein
MKIIFLPHSPYSSQARFIAIIWTLLIFVGCLFPSQQLPHVAVPFIDKWTHFVMFGGYTFLWLCAKPAYTTAYVIKLLVVAVLLGCAIEVLQGTLTALGRSMELLDAIADAVGALLGIGLYMGGRRLFTIQ